MADLVYAPLANSQTDGALLADVSAPQLVWQGITRPQQLAQYVNSRLMAAEQSLPEGARVELTIRGWQFAGRSWASYIAQKIQEAYTQGRITDPDTGGPVGTWPEYPGVIAWGDDSEDTITVRAVKGFPPVVVILWAVLGVALIVAGIWLWNTLRQSSWVASVANQKHGPGLPSPAQVAGFLVRNAAWIALGAGGLAVFGYAYPMYRRARARNTAAQAEELEAENELRAAEEGEY